MNRENLLRSCFAAISKVHWAIASITRRQTHVILPGDTLPPGAAAIETSIEADLAVQCASRTASWLRSNLWGP